MRSLTAFFVLLVVFIAPGSLAHAQGTEPASKTSGSTLRGCQQGRGQPVTQPGCCATKNHRGIEGDGSAIGCGPRRNRPTEVRLSVKPVADVSANSTTEPLSGAGTEGVHLVNTVLVQPEPGWRQSSIRHNQRLRPRRKPRSRRDGTASISSSRVPTGSSASVPMATLTLTIALTRATALPQIHS